MTDSNAHLQEAQHQPDHKMITTYADVVFGYCEGWVPVRALAEKGTADAPPHTPFLPADSGLSTKLAQQADWAASAGMALFVVPGTVATAGDARAEHVVQTQVVVVDLDHGDIDAKRTHLECHLGRPTLAVASGGITNGGIRKLHLYWRLTEPAEGEDTAAVCHAREAIAVKVGGDPAFKSIHQPIRVAGSVHAKSGNPRLVEILDHNNTDFDLMELSEAILAMPAMEGVDENVLDFNASGEKCVAVPDLFSQTIREGGVDGTTRFEALSRVMGYWIRRCRDGHVTHGAAWEEIKSYNLARIDPPWPEDRLRKEAERLWQRDLANNGDHPKQAPDRSNADNAALPVAFTEDALAAQFAECHADRWRYVAGWGQWLTWTGSVWRREGTLKAFDLVRSVCREAAASASSIRVSTKLSSAATVAAVEKLARSDRRHASTTEVWDSDPWLFNATDGIVDLRSGALKPHDPELFMTKISGAASKGECPTWEAFLKTVTGGDDELQAYLRRVAGYCLTGVTTEHALFFLYGTGANGKSVFANTLTAIMGDYATVAAMDMFMATHGDRHPTDMAGLRGARIVTSIETEQGSRWAESKLKALTGGDKITARFMRQDFFEFMPQFKLLIVGNHKPSIRNVDEAMRRRLHMIPFTVKIPAAQRDPRLSDRLLAERDGILAWALRGCLEWQQKGLCPPEAVMAATEDYFEAEDALGRWLDERCLKKPAHWTSSSELFANWKLWAETNGEYAGSMKRFSETLSARGFEKHNTRSARGFRGLALRDCDNDLFEGGEKCQ